MSKAGSSFKKFLPAFNRVLVQRFQPETITSTGIYIPSDKAAGSKVQEATVVACGPGLQNKEGVHVPMSVAAGDKVLLPEYGGTKVMLGGEDFFLFRDDDILAKFE